MKKIYLLGAICALAAAVSCQNETELPEVTLDYAKGQSAEIIAPPQGGEVSLGFKSSDVWDVTTVVNWLEFDKLSGKAGDNTLTVTVDENADLEGDRS
ncbi:MAG: BACON domain-containing protein, partial [Bacteroidales bacterium]|nr:BACON domain-containing protein [Bacteroidales bacterium]